jgi:hypothetical protein
MASLQLWKGAGVAGTPDAKPAHCDMLRGHGASVLRREPHREKLRARADEDGNGVSPMSRAGREGKQKRRL